MKKTIILSLFLALSAFAAKANILVDALNKVDLKSSLVMDRGWMPFPEYENREGWNKLLGEYKDSLILYGEPYLDNDWLVIRATDYLEYNRSGNRHAQENRLKKNAEALGALMAAELAEGKGRFLDDICNGAFLFCEATSWAVSDHLYKFQSVRSPIPDYKEHILALYQGNFSQMMAWIWHFFNKAFDKEDLAIAERIRYEVRRRELEPYMQRDDFTWMGFTPGIIPNNWNPWNNSNAIVCFMLLENDRDALAAAVEKSIHSVDSYIASLRPDGACDEGTVYWYQSAGNLLNYLECLSLITGGAISVWNEDIIRNFGEYIVNANIEGRWQANFADASPITSPIVPTIYRYATAVDSPLMKSYAASVKLTHPFDPIDVDWCCFYRSMMNLVCSRELKSIENKGFKHKDFVLYPDTELCYMRNGKGYLAAKGGNNKERHNHNDVGSIIYFYDGQPVFVDAGAGTYKKSTFDKKLRYKIWNMSSNYHNVPQLNGYAQEYGAQFKATATTADKKARIFTTDIAKAYPDSAKVRSFKLSYRLLKSGALDITYKWDMDASDKAIQLHFLLPVKPQMGAEGKIGLNAGLSLKYDSKLFEASYDEIPLKGTGVCEICGDTFYRITLASKQVLSKGSSHLIVSL